MRGSRAKLSEPALGAVHALVDELDLVTRDEFDELELRVAQLEHRLRLLEQRRLPPVGQCSRTRLLLGVPDDVHAERGEWELRKARLENRLHPLAPPLDVTMSNHMSQSSIVPVTAAAGTSHCDGRSADQPVQANATSSAMSKPTHARS